MWSYGVLVWEIFSGGRIPYSAMRNAEVIDYVSLRQDRPRTADWLPDHMGTRGLCGLNVLCTDFFYFYSRLPFSSGGRPCHPHCCVSWALAAQVVVKGRHLDRPDEAPVEVYDLMVQCWALEVRGATRARVLVCSWCWRCRVYGRH